MFCRHCGKELKEDAKFCTWCGALVDQGISQDEEQDDVSQIAAAANPSDPEMQEPSDAVQTESGKPKKRRGWIAAVIVCAVIVVVIILLFCSGVLRSPRRTVQRDYDKYLISELNPERFWDRCVCRSSKDLGLVDKETFIDSLTNQSGDNEFTLISYKAENTNKMDNGIYEVTGVLTYKDSSGQLTKEVNSFVKRSGGRYKIILYGATENESFSLDTDMDTEEGIANWISTDIFSCLDGSAIVKSEISNDSTINFGFYTSNIEAILANGDSHYSTYSEIVSVGQAETRVFYSAFNNVDADVLQLLIHDIYGYSDIGWPEGVDDGRMSLYREGNEEDNAALDALLEAEEAEDAADEDDTDADEDAGNIFEDLFGAIDDAFDASDDSGDADEEGEEGAADVQDEAGKVAEDVAKGVEEAKNSLN